MKRGITLCLRSDSDELCFSESSPLRIVAGGLTGFDYPETDLELVCDAGGKLSYLKSSMICARFLSIRFELTDGELFRSVRDRVNRMMEVGRSLTLTSCFLGRRRIASVVPCKAPEYIFDCLSTPVQIVLKLAAPEPFFKESIVYRTAVPTSRAVMSFPVSFIKGAGALTSLSTANNAAVIYNPGDTDCPVTAYLYAEGSVREPYIMLGDRKIRLTGELSEGDRVKIESGDGKHIITVNGAVRADLDRRSRFFSLAPGNNTIVVNASYGVASLRSYFEFEPRYLGI